MLQVRNQVRSLAGGGKRAAFRLTCVKPPAHVATFGGPDGTQRPSQTAMSNARSGHVLRSSHEKVLEFVSLKWLRHKVDGIRIPAETRGPLVLDAFF